MTSRSEQHAFFTHQVLEQVQRMMQGELRSLTVHAPPGIGTVSKIVELLDSNKCPNERLRCDILTERSAFEHGLEMHLRQYQVIVLDQYNMLSEEMQRQVDWALHRYWGGVIRVSQATRGLVIGEIVVG